jgi:D-3-phosphoglycerate dehydrogenase
LSVPRILLTQSIHPQAQARLAEQGDVIVAPNTAPATLRALAIGCEVVIVRAQLPDDIFDAAASLIGAVRHGAGVDMIPIAAATARGVLVANLPGVNANTVAEHVLRSMLQLARHSAPMTLRLRERSAGWARRVPSPMLGLSWPDARSDWSASATSAGRSHTCVARACR